jgi:hypothetical protein
VLKARKRRVVSRRKRIAMAMLVDKKTKRWTSVVRCWSCYRESGSVKGREGVIREGVCE